MVVLYLSRWMRNVYSCDCMGVDMSPIWFAKADV